MCAPPRKACHSSGVKRRTGPWGSLLLRRPTPPSGRLATSTQLPLEKLRELLIQQRPEPIPSGEFSIVGLSTSYLTDRRIHLRKPTTLCSPTDTQGHQVFDGARISDTIRSRPPHRQHTSTNTCPVAGKYGPDLRGPPITNTGTLGYTGRSGHVTGARGRKSQASGDSTKRTAGHENTPCGDPHQRLALFKH